jgi:hypothetical protein
MRLFALLFLGLSAFSFAEDKPDPAAIARELDWMPADFATFEKVLERARAAELPDAQTLLPHLEACLLFGDVEKLKALLPRTETAKAEIIKQKGGNEEAKEEVNHSLKLVRQFLAMAEKRPTEVARRAEMFRMVLFAQQTLEDARMVDAALDQFAIEKSLPPGTEVVWDQIRGYLSKGTHLQATGTTIFGDKFGPFKVGTTTSIPMETFRKLKDYLPAEAWEEYVPK